MDANHYVPILLTKRGERYALRDLPDSVHQAMTPMFVVAPIDWDFEEERPAKSATEHLSRLPTELHESRGSLPGFVDLPFLEDDDDLDSGFHPLVWLTAECPTPLIPTTSPGRTDAYKSAAALVVARDGLGACFRLAIPEWPSNTGAAPIDGLLAEPGLAPTDVDLVLDLGDETGDLARTAVRQELVNLPYRDDWRSVIVAGTGMPKTLPLGRGVHEIERGEWAIYQSILSHGTARVPTFGDYAIANPDPTFEIDPRWISMSANVRYTADPIWIAPKGELFKGKGGTGLGSAAVPPVLETLRAQPGYGPANHCELEQWVDAVLSGSGSTGNAETWRRYGTLHHLQRVTEQLATVHGA
ncbi:MAG: beta family protein [Acidimicrobiales bacterium]|jgi:hypothetical protein